MRFDTYEAASIFVGVMQADGHFAAILDESMGFIYGPMAIGGFRVIATDEPVEATEEPPGEGAIEGAVLNFLRLAVGAFIVLGLAVGIGIVWKAAGDSFMTGLFLLAAAVAGWLGICLALGLLMVPFTKTLRDDSSLFGGLVKGLVAFCYVGQAAFPLVYLIWVLWTMLAG